jgi:hypothetical protein
MSTYGQEDFDSWYLAYDSENKPFYDCMFHAWVAGAIWAAQKQFKAGSKPAQYISPDYMGGGLRSLPMIGPKKEEE